MTSIYTYRQGVSIPHGRAVPLIQASRPLAGETSHHKYSRCLDLLRGRRPPIWDIPLRRESHNRDIPLRRESHNREIPLRRESLNWDIPLRRESHNWDIPLRRESHNWDIPLRRESHNRDISLRRESHNWNIPLRSQSPKLNIPLRKEVPVLKRSSTEKFQLTRMSPFRHFFTEMYYYNRCSDLLRKSLPHATINWCHWLDFKKRYSSNLFWVEMISQETMF